MKTIRRYLIVRASGDLRLTTRRPTLRLDEVAYPLTVNVPDSWGRLATLSLDVTLPEAPTVEVE